jgi:CRP-like cAMP-binding protein
MILSGWLTRYKTLEDGRRQIVNFLLPGDTCDAQIYLLRQMDHSIGTLTPVV